MLVQLKLPSVLKLFVARGVHAARGKAMFVEVRIQKLPFVPLGIKRLPERKRLLITDPVLSMASSVYFSISGVTPGHSGRRYSENFPSQLQMVTGSFMDAMGKPAGRT